MKKGRGSRCSPFPLPPNAVDDMYGAPKTSVLIVDDDPSILLVSRLSLERNGEFQVRVVRSAPEALAQLETQAFDVIVSDYRMPTVNGIEFLGMLRLQDTAIPFILFTSMARHHFNSSLFDGVLTHYLSKEEGLADSCAGLAHTIRCAHEAAERNGG
jgi:CheY-like chemotaxis protein